MGLGTMGDSDIGRREIRALRQRAYRNRVAVDRILRSELGRKLYPLRELDEYRLLTLAHWAERYQVPLRFVVRTVVGYWAARLAKYTRSNKGLGCKIATLVGRRSEQVLLEEIRRQYPAGENCAERRWQRRQELLGMAARGLIKPVTLQQCQDVTEFVRRYGERIRRRRRRLDRAAGNAIRRRRPYRGNPWL